MEFTLSKPLKTHKGDVSTLTLKEPTARSFVNHGEPFKVKITGEGNAEFEFFAKPSLGFLCDSTGLDEIVLSAMSGADFWRARQAMAGLMFSVMGERPTSQSES